ncbi:MAG TPA: quinoprotein relay system zinc metallohydrolase 2 [Rhizobiales bacterium]|jgi:quinoprotein relay system zinc metallohydrolase 2|nr:quinoprotein relay system zinc metallohydrolase 2 [Hyphomicrobiales bacterium]HBH40684.1 quinoprotein relay system zinc metallohydrolase 2 [Hyphomicrobiales bacterium]
MCERHLISRQDLLRAALALAASPLLRYVPAHAADRLETSEIAPGVFVHHGRYEIQSPENRGDMANASFVVGSEAVAVIDTLGSAVLGRELRDAIRAVTDKPVRYVINTHMHPDHVFGNAAFKEDAPAFVGHHKLARGLASRADRYLAINKQMLGEEAFQGIEIVLPTVAVEDSLTLDLGGRSLVCETQRTAHTDNDLTITDTATDTLFLGDLLFSVHVPTLDGSIKGWLTLLDELSRRQAARVVPGHGPHAMELPEALEPEQHYLAAIAADVRKLIKDGKTLEDATKIAGFSERDAWKLFDQYHVRNVTAAFAELEWE